MTRLGNSEDDHSHSALQCKEIGEALDEHGREQAPRHRGRKRCSEKHALGNCKVVQDSLGGGVP